MARICTEDENTLLFSHRNLQDKVEYDIEEEEEVEVGSSFRAGSNLCEPVPDMCTADELFFKGRILPLRHSVSLDNGLTGNTRFMSRSESVNFRGTRIGPDRKIINNFIDYSQPSPQPHIRRSSSMTARVDTVRNPKSSSIWDVIRLGLVRTPEIELRSTINTKLSVTRNSSCSSTSTSSNSKKTRAGESRFRNWRRRFLFVDCKCSVSTEPIVPAKTSICSETEEKQRMIEKKKDHKTAIARKKTFEWLKELSQVGFVVDHGRRSLA